MEDINDNQEVEFEYATKLFNQKILPGPEHCDFGFCTVTVSPKKFKIIFLVVDIFN